VESQHKYKKGVRSARLLFSWINRIWWYYYNT
jgi:hypothetical protein